MRQMTGKVTREKLVTRRSALVASTALLGVATQTRVAPADEKPAERKGPTEVLLRGKVGRSGIHTFSGKRPLNLTKFLAANADGYEGDTDKLVVQVFAPAPVGTGQGDLLIQLPLDVVIESPDVIVYLETNQTIVVADRPNDKPKPDKRGL